MPQIALTSMLCAAAKGGLLNTDLLQTHRCVCALCSSCSVHVMCKNEGLRLCSEPLMCTKAHCKTHNQSFTPTHTHKNTHKHAQKATKNDYAASVMPAPEHECGDAVPDCGYLVSGDDFSTIRLFNYPVVWDDAPYKAYRYNRSVCAALRSSHALCCFPSFSLSLSPTPTNSHTSSLTHTLFTHANTLTHKYTDTQTHWHTNTNTHTTHAGVTPVT